MELLNITKDEFNIDKFINSGYYHHFNDINHNNLVQLIVTVTKENEQKIHFDTINTKIIDVSVIFNEDNVKKKRITTVEKKETKTRIPKRVIERQNLQKFGEAVNNSKNVTCKLDPVPLVTDFSDDNKGSLQKNKLDLNLDKSDIDIIRNNPDMKFSDRRKLNSYNKNPTVFTSEPPKDPENKKYIPPGRKSKNLDKPQQNKKYSVYISGFMPDFTRDDFQNLIPEDLKYIKLSLPIENDRCKGFGFIDVKNENDVEKVLTYFNGLPFRHVILRASYKK